MDAEIVGDHVRGAVSERLRPVSLPEVTGLGWIVLFFTMLRYRNAIFFNRVHLLTTVASASRGWFHQLSVVVHTCRPP